MVCHLPLVGYQPAPRPGYRPPPPNGCGSPLFGFHVSLDYIMKHLGKHELLQYTFFYVAMFYHVSQTRVINDTNVCLKFDIGIPSMTKCCNQHDRCYDSCGRQKLDCDEQFQDCLDTICRNVQQTLGLAQGVQGNNNRRQENVLFNGTT